MKLADYLNTEMSWVIDQSLQRDTLLKELAGRIGADSSLDAEQLYQALLAREKQGSTGTPEGVGLPHAMVENCDRTFVAAALMRQPVHFLTSASSRIDLVFVLVGGKDKAWEHVRLLARIARICHRPGALAYLRGAKDGEDLCRRLLEEDRRHV